MDGDDNQVHALCRAVTKAMEVAHILSGDDMMPTPQEKDAYLQLVASARSAGEHWCDPEFPANQTSISGKKEAETAAAKAQPAMPIPTAAKPGTGNTGKRTPRCRCGENAEQAVVSRDTPNKGRAYWHCARRVCGFFGWVDGGSGGGSHSGRDRKLQWARMPTSMALVTDYGFRAADLRQGGVGDCWFMSALAVVAERHDLVAKLFSVHTARDASGVYCLRLFLDGVWTS
eukprot:5774059-Pleurochrysis_carterae.AAC.4